MDYPAEIESSLEQTPLYQLEAEAAVIKAVLTDPSCIPDVVDQVSADDFYNHRNRDIFSHALDQFERHGEREVTQVIVDIQEQPTIEHALEILTSAMGDVSNAPAYAAVVRERAQLRALKARLDGVIKDIHQFKSLDLTLEGLTQTVTELETAQPTLSYESSNEILRSVIQDLDYNFRNAQSGVLPGYKTGITDLDERYGGLQDALVYIWGGRPSMGKSLVAMQVLQHIALTQLQDDEVVVVFSLEMSKKQIYTRMLSNQGNIPFGRLSKARLLEEDWSKLAAATATLKDLKMIVTDTPGQHIRQIRAMVRKIHRKRKVRAVMIDHTSLVEGDGDSQVNKVSYVSRNYKEMAKEINCPVIAITQLNRLVEQRPNKRPMNSDLRDSGSLEQDADVITFFYRDDYYNEDSPNKGVIELITRKWRDGEVGTDFALHKFEYMKIVNMAKEYQRDYEV